MLLVTLYEAQHWHAHVTGCSEKVKEFPSGSNELTAHTDASASKWVLGYPWVKTRGWYLKGHLMQLQVNNMALPGILNF
jgi:hypothetical protein